MYRAPLAVHVVWHPGFDDGPLYGDAVFRHLFEDPDDVSSHGLRIPVFHWRSSGEPDAPAPEKDIPLETAERAVVVALVDASLLGALGWIEFLDRTRSRLRGGDLIIPVQLSQERSAGDRQEIALTNVPDSLRLGKLLNEVTHRLWKELDPDSPARVPAFISYARSDGWELAERVRAFLDADGRADPFLAPRDIPRGDDWREVLRSHAGRSVLLAIRTDAYAAREWCQIEVLEAKRGRMPVVVLDALARREARGFPYLGNGPVLRWEPGDEELRLHELLGLVLREALRFRYFEQRVRRLWKLKRLTARRQVSPAPPELLTLLERAATADPSDLLVYPDPPLSSDELAVIQQLDEHVEPVTPLMVLAS
jgi:hypothetical protein